MTDEQLEFIALCQRDMIYNTNMTLDEAWAFGMKCWELGYAKDKQIGKEVQENWQRVNVITG